MRPVTDPWIGRPGRDRRRPTRRVWTRRSAFRYRDGGRPTIHDLSGRWVVASPWGKPEAATNSRVAPVSS